jgi:hypothetical protein
MKYYVMVVSNGTLQIDQITEWEGTADVIPDGAKNDFWAKCRTYNTAQDVQSAYVAIFDAQLNVIGDYKESIHHETPTE